MIPRRTCSAYISGMGDSSTCQAMTIANMRALGVTSLYVTCQCAREAILDASDWPGAIKIPALCRVLKCTCAVDGQLMCARIGKNIARQGTGVLK